MKTSVLILVQGRDFLVQLWRGREIIQTLQRHRSRERLDGEGSLLWQSQCEKRAMVSWRGFSAQTLHRDIWDWWQLDCPSSESWYIYPSLFSLSLSISFSCFGFRLFNQLNYVRPLFGSWYYLNLFYLDFHCFNPLNYIQFVLHSEFSGLLFVCMFGLGLRRCGKSCRLRWLNYLRPNIKHGEFSAEEDRIICTLFATIGSR